MTANNKKLVASLADLASLYSDRREGDLAILENRAKEIPALIADHIRALASNQYVHSAETDALRTLLGESAVESYVSSCEAARSLAALRDREGAAGLPVSGVLASEVTTEKERTVRVRPSPVNGIAGHPARTHAPATTSPATPSAAPASTSDLMGVVDLRAGAGAWNFYTAKKIVQDVGKATFAGKKLERLLLALEGERSWKGIVEVARKSQLTILVSEKAPS